MKPNNRGLYKLYWQYFYCEEEWKQKTSQISFILGAEVQVFLRNAT
jgi:hypothetical protein